MAIWGNAGAPYRRLFVLGTAINLRRRQMMSRTSRVPDVQMLLVAPPYGQTRQGVR